MEEVEARVDGARPRILLVSGEVSGDRQSALLARAIRVAAPAAELYGAGGEQMQEAGVDVRIQTSHLGCVGFTESLALFRPIQKAYAALRQLVKTDRPDVAVLVDNEGFNVLLARKLRKEGIPVILYFAPQVWLWGSWRARKVTGNSNLILAVFRKEAELYRRAGGRVEWIGHPSLDTVAPGGDYEEACQRAGLDPGRPTIGVLPGSRRQELKRLSPVMLAAMRQVKERHPELQIVLPVAAMIWRDSILRQVEQFGLSDTAVVTQDRYTLLNGCRAALVKSGTAALELGLLGVPMVVAYRMSASSHALVWLLKALLGNRFLSTPWIAMPNILLEESVVPEFYQSEATPDNLAAALLEIIESPDSAARMKSRLAHLRNCLGAEGVLRRAAELVVNEACASSASARQSQTTPD